MITSKAFWRGAAERALKTFVQTFLATLVIAVGAAATAWEVDWTTGLTSALGVALLATFFSLVTSINNADFTAGAPTTLAIVTAETEPAEQELP